MRLSWSSLRTRFVLTALVGAVVPLALIGFWLTRTAERSGRQLLHGQLAREVGGLVERTQEHWLHRRSDLLLFLENPQLRAASNDRFLREVFHTVQDDIEQVVFRDASGRPVWSLRADASARPVIERIEDGSLIVPAAATVPVRFELPDSSGTFEARVRLASLLPDLLDYPARYGGALTVIDRRTGAPLLPTRFDSLQLAQPEFEVNDTSWLTVRQSLAEPAITFVLAAPLDPFTQPFEQAATRGAAAVLLVALSAFVIATVITRRLTGSLERLATAADAVAHGDLEPKIDARGNDEVGRLARAFNVMTESLRRTLRELSQRQALAAVGEFASALAHEIRNPLTSIRLDLQLVQEKIPADSRGHTALRRALKEIERLNRTVSDGLKVARSGRIELRRLDLREALEAAAHSAAPEFAGRGARLEPPSLNGHPIWVRGDSGALTQLFLNLLINAAQALPPGGEAGTRIERAEQQVTISIWDKGPGIPEEKLKHIWEPFYSTKAEGTGLGLAISQRIAAAHGGQIEIESVLNQGTTFRIRIPLDSGIPLTP